MHKLTHLAIQASLQCNWEQAIDLNTDILASDPTNISALNRLARAYTALEQKTLAKQIYEQVLKLDKFNPIALKSLKALPSKNAHSVVVTTSEDFIEESGITRSTPLTKLAGKETLLTLSCKEPIALSPRSRLISVTRTDKTYVGSLPDDLSLRLRKLINSGYTYQSCIKHATENSVTIFIRETKRPNRVTATASFSRNLKLKTLKKKN